MVRLNTLFFLFFLVFSAQATSKDSKLSELRIYNRAILLVKENYVDPKRLNPEKMLIGALDAVEREVPEAVIEEPENGKIQVRIGEKSKKFSINKMKSLWDLSFKLRDIFEYLEDNTSEPLEKNEIEYAAVNGTLSQLDPHSVLLEPKYSKEMKLSIKGEFGGLGVVIGVRKGVLTVISPLDGTPASKSGIKALDQIIKIDNISTTNLPLDKAVEKLRGKPGTPVLLTIKRKNIASPIPIKVVRDVIKIDSVSSHLLDKKIAYIRIKSMSSADTSEEVLAALNKFKKESKDSLKGIILDLRNNPGGLLSESVAVSDLFLDGGTIVVTQGAQGAHRDEEKANPGPEKKKLPIVVLVNSGSASASEIVAGALKNQNRALILGEQTFGKGSVQILHDFPDKSSLKLTVAQYLTPGDESIQSVGITPDILAMPANIDDKNNLLLFPLTKTREGDLDSHLDSEKSLIPHKPEYELTYVMKSLTESEHEQRAVSKIFHDDFEIRLAKRILLNSKGSTRQDLLSTAKKLIPKVEQEEHKKIQVSLKKLGVDWSEPPKTPKKTRLRYRVLKSSIEPKTLKLKVTLEARNLGHHTTYQLYGISQSDTSFLTDKEFIFGKLKPKQKRTWTTEFDLPKNLFTQHNIMTISFKDNHNQEAGTLEVPLSLKGVLRPILTHRYEINGETIKVWVKNIGSGIAQEPIILLQNNGEPDAVSIEEGRQALKPLKPGESAQTKLTYKKNKDTASSPDLQIQLYDAITGEFWAEDVELSANKEISKTPPEIKWLFPANKPILAKDSFQIKAEITGKPSLKDVYLYVNDQKVRYQALKAENKKLIISEKIKLKPGINYITAIARASKNYSQRKTILIFSKTPVKKTSLAKTK